MSNQQQVDSEYHEIMIERYGEKFTSLNQEAKDAILTKFAEHYEKTGKESYAASKALASHNFQQNVQSSEKVRLVVIGCNGPRPFGGQDVVQIYGVAGFHDSDYEAGKFVALILEEDVEEKSLQEVAEEFSEFGKIIDFDCDVSQTDTVPNAWSIETPEGNESFAELTSEPDDAELPDMSERRDTIHDQIDDAEILEIGTDISLMSQEGYPADFGVDIKRIEMASLIRASVNANSARYVVQDPSFIDGSELSPAVTEAGEDQLQGIEAWSEPHIVGLEQHSTVDLYATVRKNTESGQIDLSLVGYDDVLGEATEVDVDVAADDTDDGYGGSTDSSGSTIDGDSIDEMSI